MAKRTANTKGNKQRETKETGHSAGFTMTGVLDNVYVGRKFAYAKVKVEKSNGYYDLFNIAFDLETDFPDDGTRVSICGTMTKYKDEVSFTGTDISEAEPF